MSDVECDRILKDLLIQYPIDEMVKFSEIDLQEKIQDNSFQIVKFREHYYKELANLEKLEALFEKLCGERYKFYRFEDDKEWTKVEIERYCLPSDKKIIHMKGIIRKQQTRVRFFEMAYRAFEKQQWSMKTFHDTLRSGF